MFNYKKILNIIIESDDIKIRSTGVEIIDDYIKQLEVELDFCRTELQRKNDKMFINFDNHIPKID